MFKSSQILLFLFFVFIVDISGQKSNQSNSAKQFKIDSLLHQLSVSKDNTQILCLNDLANEYRITGDLELAKTFADSALTTSKKAKWNHGKALSYNNLAYINIYESDFETAMKNAVKALQISESTDDNENLGFSYLYIGYIKQCLGENNEALNYYQKSLVIRKKIDNDYNLGFTYSYIGNYYNEQKNYDSSLYYHTQALITRLKTHDTRSVADSYLLIGSALFKLKKYDIAIKNYEFALEKYQSINDKRRLAETYRNYAEVYLYQNKLEFAEDYLSKALKLSYEIGAMDNMILIYNELANLEEKKGDFKKAYGYVRKHLEYKDSISSDNVYREVTKKILKYKVEKEEKIKILQYQKEKAIQEKNSAILIAKNKTQQYILFGAILLIGLLIIIAILIARTLKLTQSQKKVIEDQNRDITDSMIYAKRIQGAILPSKAIIKENLKESFILYKPKDIVAGDFYWMEVIDKLVLYAAADCTGHGVPGAMVSVVCHNAMNRAVREFGLTEPGKILDKTREIVVQEFEKSDEEVKDGMDIALCSLDGNKLKYAGANNPLWIIRDGVIIETSANKQPIAKFDNPEPYTTHGFELQKGDSVYIFSDGFVDQFGGEKGKKFKARALRGLLISVQNETMEEQKMIINSEFETWKGNNEQVDDVCIVGVRI